LKHIFGFCEDYEKILYGLIHTLTLVCKSNDDVIFPQNDAGAGKVSLDKISWFVPHFLPSDAEKFPLYKNIESNVLLSVGVQNETM